MTTLRAIAFVQEEGGEWKDFMPYTYVPLNEEWLMSRLNNTITQSNGQKAFLMESFIVHALRFEHGHVWDCINGWRLDLSDIDEYEFTHQVYKQLAEEADKYYAMLEYASWDGYVS